MKALWSFETSGTTSPATRRHILEDLDLQQHHWENLKYRKIILNYILQKYGVNCTELPQNKRQCRAVVKTARSSMTSLCTRRRSVQLPLHQNFCNFGYVPDGSKSSNKTVCFQLPVATCKQTQQTNGRYVTTVWRSLVQRLHWCKPDTAVMTAPHAEGSFHPFYRNGRIICVNIECHDSDLRSERMFHRRPVTYVLSVCFIDATRKHIYIYIYIYIYTFTCSDNYCCLGFHIMTHSKHVNSFYFLKNSFKKEHIFRTYIKVKFTL
jgi:hypothetical protein